MNDHWVEISTWFERVCDLPADEGLALLERECADETVRAEVLELLSASDRATETLLPSPTFREALGGGLDPGGAETKTVGPSRPRTPSILREASQHWRGLAPTDDDSP